MPAYDLWVGKVQDVSNVYFISFTFVDFNMHYECGLMQSK